MNKFKSFFSVIILALLLSGCSSGALDTVGKIISPNNNLMPIVGRWEIEKALNSDFTEVKNEDKENWTSKILQFSKEYVQVGEELYIEPQFKIKRVATDQYLLYRHKQPAEEYGIRDGEIYVITIAAKDLYSVDAILLDNGKLIIEVEDYILYLNKVSNEVDNSLIDKLKENTKDNTDEPINKAPARTGLVIGLKYTGNDRKGEVEYKYRTLWIGAEDKKLRPVMETEGIFFPRHDGFWRIEMERIILENRVEDVFYSYSVLNGSTEELNNLGLDIDKWGDKTGSITRSISYVCNNYVVIESIGEGGYASSSDRWKQNSLQLQLVDNLPNLKGIKISDIAGETGVRALNNGRREALYQPDMSIIKLLDRTPQDENYGLFRVAGHWLFKGRLNYESQGVYKFSNFNINIIPPPEVVFYDDLWVPWTQIKDRVPEAIDAYTSPNKDIAVIVAKDRILIYEINNGALGETPIKKISLKNGETVIMAEWAKGSYMENWEKSFIKNDVKIIK